jgi:hypothetical protein
MTNNTSELEILTTTYLSAMLEHLDEMHNVASEQPLTALNALGNLDVIALLREVAYVASETAAEIETKRQAFQPELKVIQGDGKANTPPDATPTLTVLVGQDKATASPIAQPKRARG